MFAKLLLIILVAGATAGLLLVNRQHRLDAAHEMTDVHGRVVTHRRTLWHLRREIAERCRPDHVRVVIEGMDQRWVPIPSRPAALPEADLRMATHEAPPADAPAPGDGDVGG